MRTILLVLLGSAFLGACTDPVIDQARIDARYMPEKADSMLAVTFAPGIGALDGGQANELRTMVTAGKHAQRDEFVVVTDGSGAGLQQARAEQVRKSLVAAGARWVDAAVEPAMAMGPDTVVVVRSEYRIAARNCPDRQTGAMWNPNESLDRNTGCADAYNMGQMLARPRDAAIGRAPGPADAQVNAAAIDRYREGKVKSASSGGGAGAAGGTGGGASPSGP
jgi:type IV pilus biogenesis protein CpaD/CtpE